MNKILNAIRPLTGRPAKLIKHGNRHEYKTDLMGDVNYSLQAEKAIDQLSTEKKQVVISAYMKEQPDEIGLDFLRKTLGEIFG